MVPVAHWVLTDRALIAALVDSMPWILAVLVCIKIPAAVWVAARLRDNGLVAGRTLVIGAICWDAAVLALWGLLVWLTPAVLFPRYFLALVAILAIPLVRLSAAPLALAWNRHR